MEAPMNYALRLLKIKNYYIKEIYDKLSKKYNPQQVHSTIKKLIISDYINDKKLVKLKIEYFITVKKYSRKYIRNYFESKCISLNLVDYYLEGYKEYVFINNKKQIINNLKEKGKKDVYIKDYLIRKGYDEQ